MKQCLVMFIFVLLTSTCLFGQTQYIIRFFAKSDGKVAVTQVDNGRIKKIGYISNDHLHSYIRRNGKTFFDIHVSRNQYQNLIGGSNLKAEADKIIEESRQGVQFSTYNKAAEERFRRIRYIPSKQIAVSSTSRKSTPPYSSIKKTNVIISIPTDGTQFKNVFGENNKSVASITALSQKLKASENNNIHCPSSSSVFHDLLYEKVKEKPVILIGHNEAGILKFPDASTIELSMVEKAINENQSYPIIYLSCNSSDYVKDYSVDFRLTYEDALWITSDFDKRILNTANNKQEFKEIFAQSLDAFIRQKKLKTKAKIVTVSIVGGSGAVYYIYEGQFDTE
jgi:hypothetical protein